MNKILLHLLIALFLSTAALPEVSRAAADSDDYVAVQVPNVSQAVAFFRDVLDCGVIAGDSAVSAANSAALLTCGQETTVEISHAANASGTMKTSKLATAPAQPLTLDIDDATSIAAWLRSHHIRLIGSPTRLTSGPDAGKVAIGFLTPWGEPLRLISRIRADDLLPVLTPAVRVAVQ